MMEYNFDGQRLIVGDCREVMKTLPSESFRLIITDPPYRIKSWKEFGANRNRTYGVPPPKYKDWLSEAHRLLAEDGNIFIFEHPRNEYPLERAMRKAGFTVKTHLVWFVTCRHSHPAKGEYNNHWEPIMWGVKNSPSYFDTKPLAGLGSGKGGDVYAAPAVNWQMGPLVPGQKPLDLIKRQIAVHSQVGDSVLDPFAGSCTSLRACRELERKGVGIEIDGGLATKALDYRDLKTANIADWVGRVE